MSEQIARFGNNKIIEELLDDSQIDKLLDDSQIAKLLDEKDEVKLISLQMEQMLSFIVTGETSETGETGETSVTELTIGETNTDLSIITEKQREEEYIADAIKQSGYGVCIICKHRTLRKATRCKKHKNTPLSRIGVPSGYSKCEVCGTKTNNMRTLCHQHQLQKDYVSKISSKKCSYCPRMVSMKCWQKYTTDNSKNVACFRHRDLSLIYNVEPVKE